MGHSRVLQPHEQTPGHRPETFPKLTVRVRFLVTRSHAAHLVSLIRGTGRVGPALVRSHTGHVEPAARATQLHGPTWPAALENRPMLYLGCAVKVSQRHALLIRRRGSIEDLLRDSGTSI